ncbi:MAG: hypothetical protein LBV79_08780 [Candidatus Adiutrix sp.]|jgi:tetrahydromethanopterin S-methyltransferase subunit C|nr:hypothetical protein [Candidatus Adiutrix sp.]
MAVQFLDITSANAEGILTVEDIFPAGIQLMMFGTDQAITQDNITIAETRKGVDGKLVGGYTPVIYPVTITLEASSPSTQNLSTVWQAMATNKRVYACHLTCTVPSIGAVFSWRVGIMKTGALFPNLQKVLAPTTWAFDFQDFERAKI